MLSRQMHLEKRRFLFLTPPLPSLDLNIVLVVALALSLHVFTANHRWCWMLPDWRGRLRCAAVFSRRTWTQVRKRRRVKRPLIRMPTNDFAHVDTQGERAPPVTAAGETKVRLILWASPASAPRTGSIIAALIVNGFQLRPTGVNMIACCLPFLASLHGSQLRASGSGWAVDAANGPLLLPLYSHYWRIWVVKWDHKWLLCRPRLCDKTLWARTAWIVWEWAERPAGCLLF